MLRRSIHGQICTVQSIATSLRRAPKPVKKPGNASSRRWKTKDNGSANSPNHRAVRSLRDPMKTHVERTSRRSVRRFRRMSRRVLIFHIATISPHSREDSQHRLLSDPIQELRRHLCEKKVRRALPGQPPILMRQGAVLHG